MAVSEYDCCDMSGPILAAMLLASAGAAGTIPAVPSVRPPAPQRMAQVTIREQVIIRVQTQSPSNSRNAQRESRSRLLPSAPIRWREKKAPRCVALNTLAGASVTQADAVDLVLRGGERLRAKLDTTCRGLDYYSGFYLKPTGDGKMCADRDTIHDRSGSQCEITSFRKLVPEP